AKLANEKGFNQPTFYQYHNITKKCYFNSYSVNEDNEQWYVIGEKDILKSDLNSINYTLAPTQDQLQKWIRDKHGIHILIIPTITSDWTFKTINVISERDNDVIKGVKDVSEIPPYKNV